MIHVTVRRKPDRSIAGFSIEGHAEYAPHGEDIVCAGVSAVSVGAANAIEALTGVELECEMKDGFLSGTVPFIERKDIEAQVQLLLESMIIGLQSIEASYESYLQIEELMTT
ncbi:ribosomal-processing cysteine protease Prp [Paenibacillus thiaminolyticus]|uniref:ribosomal-processing cysteine protease Prp n=1 Tax=Paenibacillus thiaminolyticus TaxID=49283 RepID=UPI0011630FB7|nr:ribosomal-processing cysteine protease Prp [Paenibacillus thiaminolyticus]MDG0871745.1 ribosomal-processing cysteine protease Prp [Paenibacillus thiaminolyticus]NGP61974.1 ribosomal-processing cysteine protease Prp [Paenibacillus thiaminolyticus]WCF09732.1 ribosomal-processing cysteine protease Prp [Paenibacillus thiaminolyticus]WCR29648.1 ribosomal-processing cysteine protease Prp [Paenibacillus thiaminolyticus]WII38946.1 ribosomal-processing cysteine protease Prp [Paenibacillus thiaminoly